MESVVIALVLAGLKAVPTVIEAIRASSVLTAEQKAAALGALAAELEVAKQRVAAVTFREV